VVVVQPGAGLVVPQLTLDGLPTLFRALAKVGGLRGLAAGAVQAFELALQRVQQAVEVDREDGGGADAGQLLARRTSVS
jgi:hypothetical protein